MVNSIAFAAVSPFVGHASDILGRRYFALAGCIITIVGMIVVGTAHTINVAIGGMALTGVGGGIAHVTGITGIAEMVPVRSRGKYLGTVFLIFFPMAPSSAFGSRLQCHSANY